MRASVALAVALTLFSVRAELVEARPTPQAGERPSTSSGRTEDRVDAVARRYAFDRSPTTGRLPPPAALAELWTPEGDGSHQALGRWVLAGCAAPRRIVQRDGGIRGVRARNLTLPDDDPVVVVFTDRSADDFEVGEVWEGKGVACDLLSAAACG